MWLVMSSPGVVNCRLVGRLWQLQTGRSAGPDASKDWTSKADTGDDELAGGTRGLAWCQRMCWKVGGAALVPMAWLHHVGRPIGHGVFSPLASAVLGGCGRGLAALCPAQRSYTPAAALLSPSHHLTNRTDAAVTYTQFFCPPSSLSLSASSALLPLHHHPLPPSAAAP